MPSRQLFRGLFFCFYPQPSLFKINGVKAKAARSFGATVETQPSLQTTHVLVARESARSRPFMRFLQAASLSADCAVVDSEWCSQCIDTGKLLDTRAFAIKQPPDSGVAPHGSTLNAGEPAATALRRSMASVTPPPSSTSQPHSPQQPHQASPASSVGQAPDPRSCTASPEPPTGALLPLQLASAVTSPSAKRGFYSTQPPASPASPAKRMRLVRARREDAYPSIGRDGSGSPPQAERPASPLSYDGRESGLASPPAAESAHPNQVLLDVFHDFMTARQATGDDFSARAYERALKVLQDTVSPIASYDDALRLPGFTQKMAHLVDDVHNNVLPRFIQGPMKDMTKTLALFTTVYGVGPAKARALYDRGCRTLEDIKPYVDANGIYSIAHHADFVERMSRSEVDVHYGKIKRLVADIDARVQPYCMGSYRRGEPDCGDIDVVLTREGASIHQMKKTLRALLDNMYAVGFAGHTFSMGSTRWLGATQVNGKMRRMDILLVPWQELGAAMIYYTGNNTFNRKIRLSALKQSMRLNEKGLYRTDGAGAKELIEGHDEKRIFELLGWAWLEPHERRL